MITKNYTADRTETPGDSTSTIPAAMANYWINGVNSLISDLTPLKDAGGFYAPVDFNTFIVATTTVLTDGLTIPITKLTGGINVSSNLMTLKKGYVYEFMLDLKFVGGNIGISTISVADTSNNKKLQFDAVVVSTNANTAESGNNGYGVVDLSSAGSDLQVKLWCQGQLGNPSLGNAYGGGFFVKKYKLIPFTAVT